MGWDETRGVIGVGWDGIRGVVEVGVRVSCKTSNVQPQYNMFLSGYICCIAQHTGQHLYNAEHEIHHFICRDVYPFLNSYPAEVLQC